MLSFGTKMKGYAPYMSEFYNLLVLVCLLQNVSTVNFERRKSRTASEVPLWPRFLDELSCICQCRRAGEDVVAIGVQRTVGRETVFWVAVNSHETTDAVQTIEWVLGLLYDQNSSIDGKVEAIFKTIVERSPQRIHNYRKRLENLVKSMQDKLEEYDILNEALLELLSMPHDHKEFCARAYSFRKTTACRILDAVADEHDISTPWSDLRHLIGRLGSWYRAADFVVRYSSDFENDLRSRSVQGLQFKSDCPALTIEQDIQELLSSVCTLRRSSMEQAVRVLSTATGTRERLKKPQKPFVHAEAAVARHFASRELSFARDDRYIGCSKPPCYGCQLYLKQDNIAMKHRETSGRAWLKWALPHESADGTGAQKSAIHNYTDLEIIWFLIVTAKSDVQMSLTHDKYGRKRKHDTSTGITALRAADEPQ